MPNATSHVRRARHVVLPTLAALVLACAGDDVVSQPDIADRELYWALDLNHHAVTLSTADGYDTLTLVATPRNYLGEPLAAAGAAVFTSGDVEHIAVTPEGFVQALAPLPPDRLIPVIATLTVGELTFRDSALIKVVDEPAPPTLATFSIHPLPPDTAKLAAELSASGGANVVFPIRDTLVPRGANTAGDPFDGLFAVFRSSDPRVARIHPLTGEVTGVMPGAATIYASATVFNAAKADTLPYRIGHPVLAGISVYPSSYPGPNVIYRPTIVVGTGAMILWMGHAADTADPVDLTFADPAAATAVNASVNRDRFVQLAEPYSPCGFDCDAAGDVALRPTPGTLFGITQVWGLGVRGRVFSTPGVYDYVSNAPPGGGRIIVMDERE